jgi:phage baseplate assembly protein W
VNKDGDWQFNKTTQDIETVSGPQNVVQSIECLEKTRQGEFSDYPFYGNPLLNYLGKKVKKAESAIMILQLKNVIAADPRISSVDQIELVTHKGVTSVKLTMTLKNGIPLKNITIPMR